MPGVADALGSQAKNDLKMEHEGTICGRGIEHKLADSLGAAAVPSIGYLPASLCQRLPACVSDLPCPFAPRERPAGMRQYEVKRDALPGMPAIRIMRRGTVAIIRPLARARPSQQQYAVGIELAKRCGIVLVPVEIVEERRCRKRRIAQAGDDIAA